MQVNIARVFGVQTFKITRQNPAVNRCSTNFCDKAGNGIIFKEAVMVKTWKNGWRGSVDDIL